MTDQRVIRSIAWRDLFPWLILLRTFRLAISPPVLAIATAGVVLTPLGWRLGDLLFRPGTVAAERRPLPLVTGDLADALRTLGPHEPPRAGGRGRIPDSDHSELAERVPLAWREYLPAAPTAILEAYFDLAEPLARLFRLRMTVREMAYYVLGTLWTLAVWALAGGIVSRRAVVQLATGETPALGGTVRFALRRYRWYFLSPLYPLLGVVLLAAPIALLGLPIRFSLGGGAVIAGLFWLLVAVAGLAAMWLLAGLLLGWPLMFSTISAEPDGDPFEAFSRSFSYVYGKPLNYFFYVVLAALVGAVGWGAVWGATLLVQEFGFWALAGGGGGDRVSVIREHALAFAEGQRLAGASTGLAAGTTLIGLVVALIQSVAIGFRYAFFFCVASAIYLLLRQDVDEKEMDEVFVEEATVRGTPGGAGSTPASGQPPAGGSPPE
jgi:hypothetical protein